MPLRELLSERKEPVRVTGDLGDWQPITIKFSGEVLARERAHAFKGAMFAAYPGDLVFSKIDARNGAVGVIPETMPKVVLTPEYPVMIPDAVRLRPDYLYQLMRAGHFRHDLQREASGTSGRKRITPEAFLSLLVPLPSLEEQDRLVEAYALARAQAIEKEQQAASISTESQRAFESEIGMTPPAQLPDRPVFIARFRDVDRWSHDSIMRAFCAPHAKVSAWPTVRLGEVLLEVRHGCSAGPAKQPTKLKVLKISAVTRGQLDLSEFKYLEDSPAIRGTFSLRAGDVLLCRTNGTIDYVGMSALVEEDLDDTVFPDKVIRVRVDASRLDPGFLWRLLQLPALRREIEGAARTAVGNFAIGGKDIKALVVPLPPIDVQRQITKELNDAKKRSASLREAARTLREQAWAEFEGNLFEL